MANKKLHASFRMVPVWMTFGDLFKVTIIQRQITWKWYNILLYLQWPTNKKSCIIYRTAPFSMILNDPYPIFMVTPFFDAEYLINGTTYRHSFNEIPIHNTHALLDSVISNDLEWPWVSKNIQWQEASRGLFATAELLVKYAWLLSHDAYFFYQSRFKT